METQRRNPKWDCDHVSRELDEAVSVGALSAISRSAFIRNAVELAT
jgi:hypothetical protein